MPNGSIRRATERWLLSSGHERRLLLCHGGHTASNAAVNVAFATTFVLSSGDRDAGALTGFLIFALLPFALVAPMVGILAERYALCVGRTLRNGYALRIGVLLALMIALMSGSVDTVVYPLVLTLMVLQKVHTVTVYSSVPLLRQRSGSLLDSNARVTRMATAGSLAGTIIGSVAAFAFAGAGAIAVAMGLAIVAMRAVPRHGFLPHRIDRIEIQRGTPRAVVSSAAAFALVKLAIGAMVIALSGTAASGDHDARVVAVATLLAFAVGGGIGTVVVPRVAEFVGLPSAMLASAMTAATVAALGALWQPNVLIPTMAAFIGLLGSVAHQHRDHVFQDTVPCHLLRRTFAKWDGIGQLAWVAGALVGSFGGLLLVDVVRLVGTIGMISAVVAVVLPQRRAVEPMTSRVAVDAACAGDGPITVPLAA